MSRRGPIVTDHALVRFLERAGGMPVEQLREQLSQSLARAHEAAVAIGSTECLIRVDGLSYMVRGNHVVTVMQIANHTEAFGQLRADEQRFANRD